MPIGNTPTGAGLPLGSDRYYNYDIKIHSRLKNDIIIRTIVPDIGYNYFLWRNIVDRCIGII